MCRSGLSEELLKFEHTRLLGVDKCWQIQVSEFCCFQQQLDCWLH